MLWLGYLIIAYCFCLFFTRLFYNYALTANLLDIPNNRSAHSLPTPRGGGIVFVAVFLIVLSLYAFIESINLHLLIALFGAGSLIALLGFLDDKKPLPAQARLLGHFIAAAFAVSILGAIPASSFFFWGFHWASIRVSFSILYLVWLLNLYNFMDGIDGIAAIEAMSVSLSGALLYWLQGDMTDLSLLLFLAFTVAGFLQWNFPPARIFMGDVGSGFLGIVLGIFSIQAAKLNGALFWSWLILLGVFIVDTAITLVFRGFRKENLFEAHSHHGYQHAARQYGHFIVVLYVLGINLVWLLPWAIKVSTGSINGLFGLMIAYLPLILLALLFKAGQSAVKCPV